MYGRFLGALVTSGSNTVAVGRVLCQACNNVVTASERGALSPRSRPHPHTVPAHVALTHICRLLSPTTTTPAFVPYHAAPAHATLAQVIRAGAQHAHMLHTQIPPALVPLVPTPNALTPSGPTQRLPNPLCRLCLCPRCPCPRHPGTVRHIVALVVLSFVSC